MEWTSSDFLLTEYDGFILDAYGVFWSGYSVLKPAEEFMKRAVQLGKTVIILSNATQLASVEKTKYGLHGLFEGVHYHDLLTSGEISKNLAFDKQSPFEKNWKNYFSWWANHPLFGDPQEDIFRNSEFEQVQDISKADFVYLNTPHFEGKDQIDPSIFDDQIEEIGRWKLPIICPNPDEYAQHGHPVRFVVRQGSISSRLSQKGLDVRYIGKPHKTVFDFAKSKIEQFQKKPSKMVMVGDNPRTDILGARRSGLASALLVDTGIVPHFYLYQNLEDLLKQLDPEERPDHILKALSLEQ